MAEYLPRQSYDNSRHPVQESLAEPYERERYVESRVQPGGVCELRPLYKHTDAPRVSAYIRTSALARGDVDVLQLEDVRGIFPDKDDTKLVHGRRVPGNTKYVLVGGNQQDDSGAGDASPELITLTKSQEYEYGRATESAQDFTMGSGTSRRHFKLSVSDGGDVVIVQDLGSTHGLSILELTETAVDGTPIRHPGDLVFSEYELQNIDKKLQYIATSQASDRQKHAARELVTEGKLGGKTIDYMPVTRRASSALKSREFVADVALGNLEVAHILVDKEIVGLHGTRSIALLGMMERGMQSASALRESGYPVVTGEHIFQYDNGQTSSSFSALAGSKTAIHEYAENRRTQLRSIPEVKHALLQLARSADRRLHEVKGRRKGVYAAVARDNREAAELIDREPDSLFSQMLQHDFPVVIGISRAEVERQQAEYNVNLLDGSKDHEEFRIETKDPVPIEAFPVVAVPDHYVQWVSELMRYYGHDSVTILPIEALGA